MVYDLIVVGGGPAGITAGIYGSRQKLKTLLITPSFGGQMTKKAVFISNYPGFDKISGLDLSKKFEDHLKKQKVDIEVDEVIKIEKKHLSFFVSTNKQIFESRSVIISSGAEPRRLSLKGEKEFLGKGLGYCVVCDGYIFSDKDVAVIGGGNAGFEAAQFLSKIAKKIYILEYGTKVMADKENQEITGRDKNVEIMTNVEVKEIKGNNFVNSIIYQDRETKKEKSLKVEGVFVQIGIKTKYPFMGDLISVNAKKEIVFDLETNQTKTPGLFVAGDVSVGRFKQIVIACGEGAKAALSAFNYLKIKK